MTKVVLNIQVDLMRMAALKTQAQEIADEYARLEGQVADALRMRGTKSVGVKADGRKVKGTLVEGTRVIIHEEPLLKSLDAKQRKMVTVEVLDKEKLEAAVALGAIDPMVVANASETKPIKPYIKVSGDTVPSNWKPKPRVTRPKKP